MSLFTSWLASPAPDAAIEIAPGRVSAAMLGARGSLAIQSYASDALPADAVVASLTARNIVNREAVVHSVRSVFGQLASRPARVALVIPDLAAKVSVVHFDQIPARRDDLEQLVRWQVRKAAPFPIDDAALSFTPGTRTADGGGDFIVVMARREVIAEYEAVCAAAGAHAGIVDIATFSAVNLALGSERVRTGDWLVVHMRPEYTSLAILRAGELIFFRNRPEGDADALTDVVHQTAMYYQDRLSGGGFEGVLLGGSGRTPGAVDEARRELAERLGTHAQAIEDRPAVGLPAITGARESLAPLAGILLRTSQPVTA
jgi:type IV pilus assembly protein PilM